MIEKIDIEKIYSSIAKHTAKAATLNPDGEITQIVAAAILVAIVEEINNKIDDINKEISSLKFKGGFD